MIFQSRYLFVILILATLGACEPAGDKKDAAGLAGPAGQQMPWADFRETFIEEYFEHSPSAAIGAGRHEYDGQLHDFSHTAVVAEINWLRQRRADTEAYSDVMLNGHERFERSYLVAEIDSQLYFLQESGFLQSNPVIYAFAVDPSIYLSLEYAPLADRMKAFTKHVAAVPGYLEQMRANLASPMARPHIEVALGILSGYATFFANDVPDIFSSVEDERIQTSFATANSAAIEALRQATAWLDTEMEIATDDFALGEEKFLMMLRMTEGVDLSIEELKAAGEADLERNFNALKEACESYEPGSTIHECIAKSEAIKMEGGFDVSHKPLALPVEVAGLVKIIKPGFADGNHLVTLGKFAQRVDAGFLYILVVGMDSSGAKNLIMSCNTLVHLFEGFEVNPDAKHARNTIAFDRL